MPPFLHKPVKCWVLVLILLATGTGESVAQKSRLLLRPLSASADSCLSPAQVLQTDYLPRVIVRPHKTAAPFRPGVEFSPVSKDNSFYIICGLLFFVGITTRAFPKYYADLYRVFSQSGFRQKSIRYQLVQNQIASLALNIIFYVTGGSFIYLIASQKGISPDFPWYWQVLACIGFLLIVYGTKYISLMTGGWVFSARELLVSYSFVVFFVNKIAGLFLIPVIIMLWLGSNGLHGSVTTLAFMVLSLLFLYRFFLVLPMVRSKSGVSTFHFFIYLCTFEILPILLLVKFLMNFLSASV